jgi:hypothetical protein
MIMLLKSALEMDTNEEVESLEKFFYVDSKVSEEAKHLPYCPNDVPKNKQNKQRTQKCLMQCPA